MASVLKIILGFLRRLRFPKGCYTKGCSLWAWLLTFIFRKLGLSRLWRKSPGTSHKEKPADPSVFCVDARGYSALGGSIDVVAASTVPTSASLPDLRECAPRQLTTGIPSDPITSPVLITGNLTADRALSAYDVTLPGNRSSANLSILSCASDRLSILTQSRASLRAPVGQPSRPSPSTLFSPGCVTVDIQTPSTASLTLKSSSPQSISTPGSPTVHTSAVSVATNIHKHVSPTPPPMALGFSLPEGRDVVLINSDQVPRYSSNIKMWVNVFVLLFHP
jgi:hypothetical protein